MLALNSSLPRIGHMTRADRFFAGVITLTFLSLVKGVFTVAVQCSEHIALVAMFDRAGRWMYPAALLAVLIGALVA